MFLYNNEEEFKNNIFYKSMEEVNIGVILFFFLIIKFMENFLDDFVNEFLYFIFERVFKFIGKEEYLKDEYFNNRNVLVGVLKNKE